VRLKVKYGYSRGYLASIRDFTGDVDGTVYWSQAATDPWFNAIDESYGNGLRVISGFSPITGLIDYRQSGTGGSTTNVQNLGYTWDKALNLTQRQDSRQGLTEAFYYDALNRLDYSTLNGTTNLDVTLDLIGNVTYRSDVGSYTYHATRKHAVTAAGGNTYTYDNNGNVATRNGSSIVWSSYNLPLTINGNGQAAQLAYAPDRSRWRQISSYAGGSETTIYVGGLLEKMTASASNVVRWRHLIPTPGANVQVARRSDGTNEVLYVAKDHLGSTDALLNASGTVLARASFAAYGGRRGSAWSGAPTIAEMQAYADQTRRGYTEHEMLDNVGLIHMNGRVYDPGVGRFMSADPVADGIGAPGGFNRYAYVQNSPLSLTDPFGFSGNNQCLLGRCELEEVTVTDKREYNHPNWGLIDLASRIADAFTNVEVVSGSESGELEEVVVSDRRDGEENDGDSANRIRQSLAETRRVLSQATLPSVLDTVCDLGQEFTGGVYGESWNDEAFDNYNTTMSLNRAGFTGGSIT
jgi:RHS repeat-associated protein